MTHQSVPKHCSNGDFNFPNWTTDDALGMFRLIPRQFNNGGSVERRFDLQGRVLTLCGDVLKPGQDETRLVDG